MNQDSIERIRSATFTLARRGYDRREVDQYLSKLADWLETGGGDQARSETVKRELERVGERTARILAAAEDSAQQLREEAEVEARDRIEDARRQADSARSAADKYSQKTRAEADSYSQRTRAAADKDAAERVAAAKAKAERIVAEGTQRRRDIEAVIADLVAKRDGVLADARRLSEELGKTVSAHTPAKGADPFATPAEPDPAERGNGAPARPARTRSGAS